MFPKKPVSGERRQRQAGSAMVEFSLTLLILLGFIFLLMGLAWVVFAWACIQEAVREGARTAVTCPATGLNATIEAVVEQYSFGFVNPSNVSSVFSVQYLDPTTLLPISGQVYTGDVVKVSVSNLPVYSFAPILRDNSTLIVGAVSSDIMSCPTPASQ